MTSLKSQFARVVPLHFFWSQQVQLVVLVSAFVMVIIVSSVSCLLFLLLTVPRAQPFVKVGARAPLPHGGGATGYSELCRKADAISNLILTWKSQIRMLNISVYLSSVKYSKLLTSDVVVTVVRSLFMFNIKLTYLLTYLRSCFIAWFLCNVWRRQRRSLRQRSRSLTWRRRSRAKRMRWRFARRDCFCARKDPQWSSAVIPSTTSQSTRFTFRICVRLRNDLQGGPKKVSHYRESSLNRIKNRQPG